MTKTVVAVLGLAEVDLAPGQEFDHHEITLSKDGVDGEPVSTADDEIGFDGLEPGVYVATGFSVAKDGTALSEVFASAPLTVAADPAPGRAKVLSSITLKLG